jgi:hypothetical protein
MTDPPVERAGPERGNARFFPSPWYILYERPILEASEPLRCPERRHSMAKLLGQVLMESGMISIDELNEAIEIQKSSGQKLGDILLSLGVVTEEELQMALSFQNEEEE